MLTRIEYHLEPNKHEELIHWWRNVDPLRHWDIIGAMPHPGWERKNRIHHYYMMCALTLNQYIHNRVQVWVCGVYRVNTLTSELFNWNFHPLEVVSRWRDSQLQVSENNSSLTKCIGNDFELFLIDVTFYLQHAYWKWDLIKMLIKIKKKRFKSASATKQTFIQCLFNVGPSSATLTKQHLANIVSTVR